MKKIILAIIGIVLLVVVGVGMRYLLAYNGFLDKITARKPEMKVYDVIVMEESDLWQTEDLKEKSVGFLKIDSKAANAEQKLREMIEGGSSEIDFVIDADFYDDVDTMTKALKNKITDAMVLETDRLEMLKEENMATGFRVAFSFEVELGSEDMEISDKQITKEPFILYISGSDSRTGVKTTARSDVNILAVINPKQGKILLVSIPRDTYVQLHDTVGLRDKLTHAGVYGINMSKTTIEDFLGINIDYTLKVSFDTVIKVVDQLDGIDIESDTEMTLKLESGGACGYTIGKQHVDGICALRFARERKSYETGDKHRGENQQQVIKSIINRLVSSKDYLLKIPTILDIAADSFETTISRENISGFVRMQLIDGVKWNIESIAIDGDGTYEPTYSMGENLPLYVMIPYEDSALSVKNKIIEYLEDALVEDDATEKSNVENVE